jgi:pimeloyl-ACP methyl ester carboxylesterase
VRFDNRDSGHSSHLRDAPPADLPAALKGDFSSVSYTLSDMAADAVGLLDALNIDAAHVVGASMGGIIAQTSRGDGAQPPTWFVGANRRSNRCGRAAW